MDAYPGGLLDVEVGDVDGLWLLASRVVLAQRLGTAGLVALLDTEAGYLGGFTLAEVGAGLVGHLGEVSVGGRVGHRWFASFEVVVGTLQAEWHATPEVGFVAMGHWEGAAVGDDTWRAALGARAFPFRSLFCEIGVGFNRIGQDNFGGDTSDPYLSVEWQLPINTEDWQVALFVERQVSTLDLAGLRLGYGMGQSAHEVVRGAGWRPVR